MRQWYCFWSDNDVIAKQLAAQLDKMKRLKRNWEAMSEL